MKGRDKNYNFGEKKCYRRTIWNKIKNNLNVPVRAATVLYMGGAEDLDREVACKKGFDGNNLIFVDNDITVIENVRGSKKIAVYGEAIEIAIELALRKKVDAVYFDFCGGITEKRFFNLILFLSYFGFNGVFAANFLRGRDSFASKNLQKNIPYIGKHRGKMFFSSYLDLYTIACACFHYGLIGNDKIEKPQELVDYLFLMASCARDMKIDEWVVSFFKDKLADNFFRPEFYTYKSKNNKAVNNFDSVVFRVRPIFNVNGGVYTASKSNVNACLAIKTMRKNGNLTQSPTI